MHILVVAHYYPPLNAIASFRPASFAKYFVENGVDVTVLTTKKIKSDGGMDLELFEHPRLKIVEVPYRHLQFWRKESQEESPSPNIHKSIEVRSSRVKAILTSMRKWGVAQLGSLVDYQFFWTKEAVKRFDEIHHQKPIDVIISSFGPPAAHFIASSGVKRYPNISWISDYRDLWSNSHIVVAKGGFYYLERFIEKRVVGRANMLTTVSQPLALELSELFENKIPVSTIYNGYDKIIDSAMLKSTKVINTSIRIVYTGTIYKGRRDPSPLLVALNELEHEGVIVKGNIQIDFYGANAANLNEVVTQCNAHKWVKIYGQVSYQESLKAQEEANFLLHLESNKPDARGVLTGKLFEYMVTGNTILAIGVDDHCASAQVINETRTGVVFGDDVQRIKNYLKQVWLDKQEPIRCPDVEAIAQYSRTKQANKMLNIAKSLKAGQASEMLI